jgi:hypothetical protein
MADMWLDLTSDIDRGARKQGDHQTYTEAREETTKCMFPLLSWFLVKEFPPCHTRFSHLPPRAAHPEYACSFPDIGKIEEQ